MIFDRGAETVLPFFRATDIARELKNVIENVGIGAELIAAEITDEMLAPFTDTGLSNGKVGMDNDSDVFNYTDTHSR